MLAQVTVYRIRYQGVNIMSHQSFRRFTAVVATVGTALALAPAAFAASPATSDMSVTSSIVANCTISSTTLALGAYDAIVTNNTTALTATSTVTVTCTNGAPVTVRLGQGANAGSGSTDAVPVRRLVNGTSFMSYELYKDSGYATVWGNDTATGVGRTGTGSADTLTVYAKVAPGQTTLKTGNYTDTVTASVDF